jgi:hypothetical protein
MRCTAMAEKTISKLSVASILLSASSIFLLLSWVPGVICGHIARSKLKAHPNLRGAELALVGLVIGYLFPVILAGIFLYLGGYFERQVVVIDRGQTIWTGSFPHDANGKDPLKRANVVLTPIVVNGQNVGAIESRDKNQCLVFKRGADGKEFTVWKYRDYGAVTKITIDEGIPALKLYYDNTLLRNKNYCVVVTLSDSAVNNHLVDRGRWHF